jgi:hypothetical protein
MVAAVFSDLQTFVNYSDRANDHKHAGSRYSVIRRNIEIYMLRLTSISVISHDDYLHELESIVNNITHVAHESPRVPERFCSKPTEKKPFRLLVFTNYGCLPI